ncbi:MAG: membrane protein insertase YidC, partial [Alphaproteobacteria bacterium]|nr:membrane protein insertase YidC [Alphaproteobacteria bacterium]
MNDQKNLIIAIVLSVGIMMAWQFLYEAPRLEKSREAQRQEQALAQAQTQAQAPAAPATGAPAAPGAQPATVPGQSLVAALAASREAAIAATPRLAIDTPKLRGSINLKGGRVDDLVLKGYREEVKPNSPEIVLLAPAGSPHPY